MSKVPVETKNKLVQTRIRCFPRSPENITGSVKVLSDRSCQTAVAVQPDTLNIHIYTILEFTPYQVIAEGSVKEVDLPRKALLQWKPPTFFEERSSSNNTENYSNRKLAKKDSVSASDGFITRPIKNKRYKMKTEAVTIDTQTSISIAPYGVDNNEPVSVVAQIFTQTSISCVPEESISKLIPLLKANLVHKPYSSTVTALGDNDDETVDDESEPKKGNNEDSTDEEANEELSQTNEPETIAGESLPEKSDEETSQIFKTETITSESLPEKSGENISQIHETVTVESLPEKSDEETSKMDEATELLPDKSSEDISQINESEAVTTESLLEKSDEETSEMHETATAAAEPLLERSREDISHIYKSDAVTAKSFPETANGETSQLYETETVGTEPLPKKSSENISQIHETEAVTAELVPKKSDEEISPMFETGTAAAELLPKKSDQEISPIYETGVVTAESLLEKSDVIDTSFGERHSVTNTEHTSNDKTLKANSASASDSFINPPNRNNDYKIGTELVSIGIQTSLTVTPQVIDNSELVNMCTEISTQTSVTCVLEKSISKMLLLIRAHLNHEPDSSAATAQNIENENTPIILIEEDKNRGTVNTTDKEPNELYERDEMETVTAEPLSEKSKAPSDTFTEDRYLTIKTENNSNVQVLKQHRTSATETLITLSIKNGSYEMEPEIKAKENQSSLSVARRILGYVVANLFDDMSVQTSITCAPEASDNNLLPLLRSNLVHVPFTSDAVAQKLNQHTLLSSIAEGDNEYENNVDALNATLVRTPDASDARVEENVEVGHIIFPAIVEGDYENKNGDDAAPLLTSNSINTLTKQVADERVIPSSTIDGDHISGICVDVDEGAPFPPTVEGGYKYENGDELISLQKGNLGHASRSSDATVQTVRESSIPSLVGEAGYKYKNTDDAEALPKADLNADDNVETSQRVNLTYLSSAASIQNADVQNTAVSSVVTGAPEDETDNNEGKRQDDKEYTTDDKLDKTVYQSDETETVTTESLPDKFKKILNNEFANDVHSLTKNVNLIADVVGTNKQEVDDSISKSLEQKLKSDNISSKRSKESVGGELTASLSGSKIRQETCKCEINLFNSIAKKLELQSTMLNLTPQIFPIEDNFEDGMMQILKSVVGTLTNGMAELLQMFIKDGTSPECPCTKSVKDTFVQAISEHKLPTDEPQMNTDMSTLHGTSNKKTDHEVLSEQTKSSSEYLRTLDKNDAFNSKFLACKCSKNINISGISNENKEIREVSLTRKYLDHATKLPKIIKENIVEEITRRIVFDDNNETIIEEKIKTTTVKDFPEQPCRCANKLIDVEHVDSKTNELEIVTKKLVQNEDVNIKKIRGTADIATVDKNVDKDNKLAHKKACKCEEDANENNSAEGLGFTIVKGSAESIQAAKVSAPSIDKNILDIPTVEPTTAIAEMIGDSSDTKRYNNIECECQPREAGAAPPSLHPENALVQPALHISEDSGISFVPRRCSNEETTPETLKVDIHTTYSCPENNFSTKVNVQTGPSVSNIKEQVIRLTVVYKQGAIEPEMRTEELLTPGRKITIAPNKLCDLDVASVYQQYDKVDNDVGLLCECNKLVCARHQSTNFSNSLYNPTQGTTTNNDYTLQNTENRRPSSECPVHCKKPSISPKSNNSSRQPKMARNSDTEITITYTAGGDCEQSLTNAPRNRSSTLMYDQDLPFNEPYLDALLDTDSTLGVQTEITLGNKLESESLSSIGQEDEEVIPCGSKTEIPWRKLCLPIYGSYKIQPVPQSQRAKATPKAVVVEKSVETKETQTENEREEVQLPKAAPAEYSPNKSPGTPLPKETQPSKSPMEESVPKEMSAGKISTTQRWSVDKPRTSIQSATPTEVHSSEATSSNQQLTQELPPREPSIVMSAKGPSLEGQLSQEPPALTKDPSVKEVSIKEPSTKEFSIKEMLSNEPSVKEPSIKELSIKEPSVKELLINEPSVKELSIKEPSIKELSIKDPSIKELSIKEPSIKELSIKELSIKEPSVKELSIRDPSTKEFFTKEASIKELSIKEPSFKELPTKEPSFKEPPLREQSIKELSAKGPSIKELPIKEPSAKELPTEKQLPQELPAKTPPAYEPSKKKLSIEKSPYEGNKQIYTAPVTYHPECGESKRPQKQPLLFEIDEFKANEPYLEGLYRAFPNSDEEDSGECGPETEIPWQDIILPQKCTIRKIPKRKKCICKTVSNTQSDEEPAGTLPSYQYPPKFFQNSDTDEMPSTATYSSVSQQSVAPSVINEYISMIAEYPSSVMTVDDRTVEDDNLSVFSTMSTVRRKVKKSPNDLKLQIDFGDSSNYSISVKGTHGLPEAIVPKEDEIHATASEPFNITKDSGGGDPRSSFAINIKSKDSNYESEEVPISKISELLELPDAQNFTDPDFTALPDQQNFTDLQSSETLTTPDTRVDNEVETALEETESNNNIDNIVLAGNAGDKQQTQISSQTVMEEGELLSDTKSVKEPSEGSHSKKSVKEPPECIDSIKSVGIDSIKSVGIDSKKSAKEPSEGSDSIKSVGLGSKKSAKEPPESITSKKSVKEPPEDIDSKKSVKEPPEGVASKLKVSAEDVKYLNEQEISDILPHTLEEKYINTTAKTSSTTSARRSIIPECAAPCATIAKELVQQIEMPTVSKDKTILETFKQDPVVAALESYEAEMKPLKQALTQLQEKIRNLNMPEMNSCKCKTTLKILPQTPAQQRPIQSPQHQPIYPSQQQPMYSPQQQPMYPLQNQLMYSLPPMNSPQQQQIYAPQQEMFSSQQQPIYSAQQPMYLPQQQPIYAPNPLPMYSQQQHTIQPLATIRNRFHIINAERGAAARTIMRFKPPPQSPVPYISRATSYSQQAAIQRPPAASSEQLPMPIIAPTFQPIASSTSPYNPPETQREQYYDTSQTPKYSMKIAHTKTTKYEQDDKKHHPKRSRSDGPKEDLAYQARNYGMYPDCRGRTYANEEKVSQNSNVDSKHTKKNHKSNRKRSQASTSDLTSQGESDGEDLHVRRETSNHKVKHRHSHKHKSSKSGKKRSKTNTCSHCMESVESQRIRPEKALKTSPEEFLPQSSSSKKRSHHKRHSRSPCVTNSCPSKSKSKTKNSCFE